MRILHCHSTFNLGGKEARSVRLMNAFGDAATHTVITAVSGALSARDAINPGIAVAFPDNAPSLTGKPAPLRYRQIAKYMRGFDLVLTYNWGSMDAVGARRVFGRSGPPLIHHEDGFNEDEAIKLNPKRNAYRRLMLKAAKAVVVPSQRLESIALGIWKQPRDRLHRIANGIDIARYAPPPVDDAIPGFERHSGDVVIGTIAGLRAVKNLPRLVRAFATLPSHARLIIVGEGPERGAIMAQAVQSGVADRILMPGFLPAPHRYVGHFDIFALSSDSEQFPISLVEAMAAGVPVVCTDVGDVATMVSPANRPYVVPASDDVAFARALGQLVTHEGTRASIGASNRQVANVSYDEAIMIRRYARLYGVPA